MKIVTLLNLWPIPLPVDVSREMVALGTSRLTISQAFLALAAAGAGSVRLAGTPEVLPTQRTVVMPLYWLMKAEMAARSLAITGPRSPR